jgi:DNA-binding NarL/FixJ family response regulator
MSHTLIIADDHQMIRTGLSASLERRGGFLVVAQASTGAEAILAAREHQPDVVILDMRLPDMAGFRVCHQIVSNCPETAVLMLATDDWDVHLTQAYDCGASGFLSKELALESLIDAVTQVAEGQSAYTPQQHERIQQWQTNINSRLSSLTDREEDVFWAMIQNQTNSEIADALHISIRTVESHVRHILQKLDLSSRRELRRWAVKNHLMVMQI